MVKMSAIWLNQVNMTRDCHRPIHGSARKRNRTFAHDVLSSSARLSIPDLGLLTYFRGNVLSAWLRDTSHALIRAFLFFEPHI